MNILFIISVLFHLSNWVQPFEIPIIGNIQDMIGLAHDVGDIAAGNIPFKNFFSPAANPLIPVLDKLDGITEQLENLDMKLDDLLATLISRLPLEDQINTDIRNLQEHISRVDRIYGDFLAYAENVTVYDDDTLLDFVDTVTSAKFGNVPDTMHVIFNIVVPKKSALARVGFLENMLQRRKMMTPQELCGSPISFQNRLLQMYNLISLTEIRALVMTMFGYRLKMELKQSKSIGEIARTRSSFVMRLDQYLLEFKKVMRKASREIFLCDPELLTDPSTYLEFEGLFTAFVINEQQVVSECHTTCPELWINSNNSLPCYGYTNEYCVKHPCQGTVHSCNWIGGNVDMCEYPADSLKRYEWVRSYSNGWYGQNSNCPSGTYEQVHADTFEFYRCDTCICKCEEYFRGSRAIRTLSLRRQITNIAENKVISDVKFTLKDKMIHIQIEEAPLLPLGQLDKNESSWVPLEKFEYFYEYEDGLYALDDGYDYFPLNIDVDYTFIRADHKTLHLDEISAGPNYVLTGARLNHKAVIFANDGSSRNVSPIQLEIHVTPFDYASGKLIPTDDNPSKWITPQTQPIPSTAYVKEREEIGNGAEKTYKYQSVQNPPHLKPNKYVKFKQSSIFDDAGQSTVPFFEARPTASNNTLAFDGLGLAYRGHYQYAGFVLFKALTIDATNYINAEMTAEQQKYHMQHSRQAAPNSQPKRRGRNRQRR